MTPRQLLDSGKLSDALRALTAEVRDNPTDVQRRTFLFELLSFVGEYDRAEKHLDVLAQEGQSASMGALLYRAALHAEKLRQNMFAKKEYPAQPTEDVAQGPRPVIVNGTAFQTFIDSDPRINARLELFAAGSYLWIPFEHIESIEIEPPKRLRDLLWAPALVRTGPAFRMRELGEVLLPVLSPYSWKHSDDAVRLGRASVWESDESGESIPFGQKMFLVDDEDLPLLELRTLQFTPKGRQRLKTMPLREDLLVPVSSDKPSGENLRYAPIYDKIKEARRKEDVIAQGEWGRPLKEADYRLVIKLATEALATKSKDLQLAAWLTEALVCEQGLKGLTDGLDLLSGLVENFWDAVYPEAEDGDLELRAAPLNWVGDYRDLELAVHSIPLTRGGLDWFKYKQSCSVGYETDCADNSAKLEARRQAIDEGKLTAEEFDQDFAASPKADFQALFDDAGKALESIQRLDALCEQKFGSDAPSFRRLRVALEDVEHVAKILLARKREQEPDPVDASSEPVEETAEPESYEDQISTNVAAAPAAGTAPKRKALAAEPADREDAINRVLVAARFLRAEDPFDPLPYLLVRSLRWGELRAQGENLAAEFLEAPTTEVRQELRRLALAGDWLPVLETAEKAMSTPYGRGWLDLQRYIVRACTELGSSADRVSSAISSELKALLAHLPQLPQMTLSDDTPTANSETQAWLKVLMQDQLVAREPETDPIPSPDAEETKEGEPAAAVDPYELAFDALRSREPEEAMRILAREIAHERSGRGRFLRRTQLARICMASNQEAIAHAILEEVVREIELRKLEDWEPPETIAQPLAMLYQCMEKLQTSDGERRRIYAQICRLDPVQAARLAG